MKIRQQLLNHLLDRRLVCVRLLLALTSHKFPNDIRVMHVVRFLRFSPNGFASFFVAFILA